MSEMIPFRFSAQSAAKAQEEYLYVLRAIRQCFKYGQHRQDDLRIVRQIMRSPGMKPDRSPFTCWLATEEWNVLSRALRRWRNKPPYPKAYMIMSRAKYRQPNGNQVQ